MLIAVLFLFFESGRQLFKNCVCAAVFLWPPLGARLGGTSPQALSSPERPPSGAKIAPKIVLGGRTAGDALIPAGIGCHRVTPAGLNPMSLKIAAPTISCSVKLCVLAFALVNQSLTAEG